MRSAVYAALYALGPGAFGIRNAAILSSGACLGAQRLGPPQSRPSGFVGKGGAARPRRLRASALSRSGWAHGRTAFAATQAKPSPTAWALGFCFRSAPSSPMRLPSRFGVTLRLLATRGLRCGSDKTSPRCAAGFLPSLRSVRAAHDGSALRFCDHAYITIRPPGLSREGGKFFAMG